MRREVASDEHSIDEHIVLHRSDVKLQTVSANQYLLLLVLSLAKLLLSKSIDSEVQYHREQKVRSPPDRPPMYDLCRVKVK